MMIQGRQTFVHARAVKGGTDCLLVGSAAMVKVVRDGSQGENKFRALEAWTLAHWRAEKDMKTAFKRAETSRRAAAIANRSTTKAAEATVNILERSLASWITAKPPGLGGRLRRGAENTIADPASPQTPSEATSDKAPENFLNPPLSGSIKSMVPPSEDQCPSAPWPHIEVQIEEREIEKLLEDLSRVALGRRANSGGCSKHAG